MTQLTLFIALFFSVFFSEYTWANSSNEKFVPAISYTTKKGLLSNDIQDIAQDKDGFIWLATTKGLNRYDSKSFDRFVYDKLKTDSIPDNYIEDLKLMPDGGILLSILERGVSVFNKDTNTAKNLKNSDSPLFKLRNKNLLGMDVDKNHNIWFSLYGDGIYQWDIRLEKFYKHRHSDENAWLTSKYTFEIFIDSQNRLWVCTIDSKVFLYEIDTGKSKEFDFAENSDDPLSNPIYNFTQASNGSILAGGYSGVYEYDETEMKFKTVVSKQTIAKEYNGERTSVRRLLMDSKDNLWIGTTKSLLQLSNNKLFKVRLFEDGEVFDKLGWTVHSIIEATDGNIWIGTEGIGLLKIPSDWNRYNTYISSSKEPKDIRRAFLYHEDLWIVHPSSKLDMIKIENESFSSIKSISHYLGENLIRINSIIQDHDDHLWVSSIAGIHKINTSTSLSTKVLSHKKRELGNARLLYKAKNNKFYFSLFGEEVGYFNPVDMKAHLIENTPANHIKGALVFQIGDGINNKLWLATNSGIETLDLDSNVYSSIYEVKDSESISSFYLEESTGNVWAINDGNLILLKWNGNKLVKQNVDYINSISTVKLEKIEKYGDKLYLSTYGSGLITFNTVTHEVANFSQENGLPSNDIIKTFMFQNKLIIVTESGVVIENSDFVELEELKSNIVIDKVSLSNKTLSKEERKNLILEYNYGSINFNVTLLSYTDSSTFEYQYRLKGATNDWIDAGNDDRFAFLNLKGGNYNFQVKGRSNYGKWSEIARFPFTVKVAPWKTFWAYGLYCIAGLLILSWFLYLYKRKILYENQITKKQAQKDLADAASKAKSDFLSRVSHEVRTPLNGVLGMSELLLDTQVDEEQKIYADTIHTSGKHLLDIINDILDLSKIEAGKLELEKIEFDLLLVVDEVVSSFISQSRQKQLMFSCCFDHKIKRQRVGDVIRIKQILFNLLSNAFKFTKEGEISLSIQGHSNSNKIIVSVTDTGVGIKPELVETLFEPFVQADSAITRKFGGTGLGLAICKQLSEKMDGSIRVQSHAQGGSIFTAEIDLKASDSIVDNIYSKNNAEICLLLKNSNNKNSLIEYCRILQLVLSSEITAKTDCLIIDASAISHARFDKVISEAKKLKVNIVYVGFEESSDLERLNLLKTPFQLVPPPLTFNKIRELCMSHPIENSPNNAQAMLIKHKKTLKLLVVEDSEINQQVSIEMLEKMGHIVDVVDNAEEAIIMLQRNNYDLLFLDYHLPGMDGFSLIKKWDNTKKIPVIMITASLTDEVLIKSQQHNIVEIVAKPFSQKALSDSILKAIDE